MVSHRSDQAETKATHVADIDSNPTANPISISPLRIWFATFETAIRPEEQKLSGGCVVISSGPFVTSARGEAHRLMTWTGTVSGKPAAIADARAS